MILACAINIHVRASDIDIPTINIQHCDNNIDAFLQAICDDIFKKSGEKFIPNNSLIGCGWQSNVYQLKGKNEDLCVKVFKPDRLRRLTNGYDKEHKYFYNITKAEYIDNFLVHIRNPKIENISLPVAAYKFESFFANISRFSGSMQLSELTNNKVILSEEQAKIIIHDILNGQNYLHSSNYSHNDLYPPNIVINTENNGSLRAFIIDANTIHKKNDSKILNSIIKITGYRIWRYINFLTLNSIWPYVNLNQSYYDPEDLRYVTVDEKSDVFATGVIMWELLFGSCPFAGCNLGSMSTSEAILKLDESLDWLRDNNNISKDCKDLLLKLLNPKKSERISSSDAFKHNFLK